MKIDSYDGNSRALAKHMEREEEQDAIAEMMQLGADEKSQEDNALSLIEEGLIYTLITKALYKHEEFRNKLLTDPGGSALIAEDELIKLCKEWDSSK